MYLAVLGVAMIVTIIGLSGLAAARLQGRASRHVIEAAEARLCAEAGVDLVAYVMQQDSAWRTTKSSGQWWAGRAIGDGTVTVSVTDPLDGNLANREYDPVLVRCTGVRGNAQHILEVTLEPMGTPLPLLSTAIHTRGQLHITAGAQLRATGAPASTGGTLANEGTIVGSAECLIASPQGTVTGTLTQGAAAKAVPASNVAARYAALGTVISPGGLMESMVLSPGLNPYGAENADGVYVVTADSDLTIRNARIHGTLVVIAPGRTVRIRDSVFMHPARADYPTLIVDGTLALEITAGTPLSEGSMGVNYNPAGAPYMDQVDAVNDDSYPAEIQGLVHCKGQATVTASSLVRGMMIVESSAVSNAVSVSGTCEVIHDPALVTNPPMGYTSAVGMRIKPGSWQQSVAP